MLKKIVFMLAVGCLWAEVPAKPVKLDTEVKASQVVDLSHPMWPEMPFWPGGVPFQMDRLVDYSDGYRLHQFHMGENTGTHVDAPSHFIEGNLSIDEIPLNKLIVPAVVIDVQDRVALNADYQLSREDILIWEQVHGKIKKGTLVILNTGWYKRFSDPEKYINMDGNKQMHFPGFSPDAARLLTDRDVAGIGIDTLSLDYGLSVSFETHTIMLKDNRYQIENMNNLDLLPATGSVVVVGVLPVKGGSQAQARILGLLP